MVKEDFVRSDGMVPVETPDGEIIWEPYQPGRLPDGSTVDWWNEAPVANDPINMGLVQIRKLPDSGVITMDDIRKEVSVTGTCNLNQQEFRDLINKSSGQQQALSDYYGKSAVQLGDGEIGTGGNCFPSPSTSGTRAWGNNSAYSKDGYCGWYNKIPSMTGFYSCQSTWSLPWMSVRNRVANVRLSYRAMCSCSPSQSNLSLRQYNSLLCGGTSSQNDGYYFNSYYSGGPNQSQSNSYNGAFIMGDLMEYPGNPSWGYVGWQRAMMNGGTVGYSWDGDFANDYYGCDPEFSWVNKAGSARSPSGLPNNGNDPAELTYIHYSSWGNYANALHRTLYIRMENA